ncbi:hypothetical protein HYPSUDRAFT_49380 [Hypholoma sublateritium FD-334 SS-4]|uniref:RTA1 like protein n=1 Tax=Hypholoma sublateritium (strain FD-334 SS-4) TaxID=945553 RepID=A0A0D2P0J5_HYPSF|nr:hypothetical protein HYPSUDRAFT_49380 [Hypholoma sublateritium FD-334 SS-4]
MGSQAHNSDLTSPYGYTPTRSVAFVFLALFGISTAIHIGQAIKYRMWFLFLTVILCGAIELLGWSGRLWSTYNVLSQPAFSIEITGTIIAPTPLLAANFVILGRIIRRLGPEYSRLRPRLYTIIFTSSDVISLVVQALGGGVASGANSDSVATTGANIILAGIIIQLVIIVIYGILATEFYVRYTSAESRLTKESIDGAQSTPRAPLTRDIVIMCLALALSTSLLLIRAIYRVAELADGWLGPVMTNQVAFIVLDGVMVVIAMYTINLAHPGRLLKPEPADSDVRENTS